MFDTPDPGSDPITRQADRRGPARGRPGGRGPGQVRRARSELDGLAYYYEGEQGSRDAASWSRNLIVGNSLLTAAGFPMCGESDLKTCIAMLIMDRLDIGGSFAEFHPIDFREGFVLVGHDGPHHLNIADGRPVLRSLTKYHGKPGSGASVEFKIKEGPITMLSIGSTARGQVQVRARRGRSRCQGPIPPTGQHEHPRASSSPTCGRSSSAGWPKGPRTTSPWASATTPRPSASWPEILGVEAAVIARS